jgi:hypothetical protein
MGQIRSNLYNKKGIINENFINESTINKGINIYFEDIDRFYNAQCDYSSLEDLNQSLLKFFCIPCDCQTLIIKEDQTNSQLNLKISGLHNYLIKIDLILNHENSIEFKTLK